MPSLRDLLERRVPQYLAVYLGVGWGLIEFLSFVEERYALAAVWTDLLLLAWALFIPSILLFTWYHGRPGRDEWVRVEKIFIPLNACVVLAVLGTAFTDRGVAATTTVTLVDETGATVERAVARSEYRKRLAIFNFDVPPGDTALAWLGLGGPALLAMDLSQDIFLDLHGTHNFRQRLEGAGVAVDGSVPLAIQRRIAEDLHLPYFMHGAVKREGSALTMRVALHATATAELIAERVVTGTDVLALVDELTPLVKQDLGLPRTQPGVVKDLPVVELLSSSREAVRGLMAAEAAMLRDDWAAAEEHTVRATELDPTFALAHFALHLVRSVRGNPLGALPALNAAMTHLHRMPERLQYAVKAEHFIARREMDKAYAVITMMTELYPDDLQGHTWRLQLERLRNDVPGAITTLRRIMELDPQQHELLLQIGSLQESRAAHEDALATYASYAARFPDDHVVQVRMARAQQRLGRHTEARAALDRALLLDPMDVDAVLQLARLLLHNGDFSAAWQRIEEARSLARRPQQRAAVYDAVQEWHDVRGQPRRAVAAGEQRLAAAAEYQVPVVALSERMALLTLRMQAGQQAEAEAELARIRSEMSGQLGEFWRVGQLRIALELRDTVQLREAMTDVRQIIRDFNIHTLEAGIASGDAVVHEVRGDWAGALRARERQKQLDPANTAHNVGIARALRHLGRHADAQRALEEHLLAVPAAPLTHLEAARLGLARNDTAAARRHLQHAARAWEQAEPGYAPARELKALLAQTGG